jgi:WD40 repeat protein
MSCRGQLLASCSIDQTVCIWDAASESCLSSTFFEFQHGCCAVSMVAALTPSSDWPTCSSPSSQSLGMVGAGNMAGSVHVWQLEQGDATQALQAEMKMQLKLVAAGTPLETKGEG